MEKFSLREKEDLYRKKRNQYIRSVALRGGVHREEADIDTGEEHFSEGSAGIESSDKEIVSEGRLLSDELLGRNDLDEFKELISEDYQYGIITRQYHAALVYDVADGKRVKYGIYLTALYDERIELLWMHLFDPNISTEEKGRFISHCITADMPRWERALKGAFVEIPMDEAWDDALEALKLSGMEAVVSDSHMFEFTLSQVTEIDVLEKSSSHVSCVALLEADVNLLAKCEKLILDDARPSPFPFFVEWSRYLPDISFICVKDKKPCGALLCTMESDHIVLDAVYTTDPCALAAMLWEALLIAIQIYGKDQLVLAPAVVEQSETLIQRLVPEASREKLITGSIKF